MAELVGKKIGKFQIERRLGRGGMGTVYEALDLNLTRKVALKVMREDLAEEPQFQQRFIQEAKAAATLGDHRSIITIYEFDYREDVLFLAMELVPGGTIGDHLKRAQQAGKAIELRETLYVLAQVADALDYAHRHGAIHRDIKPSNILLKKLDKPDMDEEPPLRAVVTDFGLAKLVEEDMQTQRGTYLGTLPYMSPEQCLGEELDGRSDIYSLGVVLYLLTTGQMPLDIKTPTQAVLKHQTEIPPPPREVCPALPEPVERIILKAIARQPTDRFSAADQMARALRHTASTLTDEIMAQYAPRDSVVSMVTRLMPPEQERKPIDVESALLRPAATARLVLGRTGEQARDVMLGKGVLTIGRSSENDIPLDDTMVSRHHARVEFDGTNCTIVDLGSTNKTVLEGAELLPGVPEIWTPDKRVRIGDTWLHLVPAGEAPSSIVSDVDGTLVNQHLVSGSGPAKVLMEKRDLVVDAGGSVSADLVVHNLGLEVMHFEVSVEGLPGGWVTLSTEQLKLMPRNQRDNQQQVTLTLHPLRSPQSRAGEYRYTVRISSQDGLVEVPGTLTVRPYSQFTSGLAPQKIRSGAPCRVTVQNEGNAEESFALGWQDRAAELEFQPSQASLAVDAGSSAVAEFRASPRQRRWIGGEKAHPFTAQVGTATGRPQTHSGEVVSRGLIPAWVPPLVIAFCLLLIYLLWPRPEPLVTVPYVGGSNVAQAKATIAQSGLVVAVASDEQYDDFIPRGLVIGTEPESGAARPRGSEVVLVVSKGHEPVPVPMIEEGSTVEQATDVLNKAGLQAGAIHGEEHHASVAAGQVIRTDPAGGSTVEYDSEVTLVVSLGHRPVEVPTDLAGLAVDKVVAKLEEVGLKGVERERTSHKTVPADCIIETRPAGGETVQYGSEVELVVSDGRLLITVPDVAGKTVAEAKSTLEQAGLKVKPAHESQYHDTIAEEHVISTDPPAGNVILQGDEVTVVVSRGHGPVTVPRVALLSRDQATTKLSEVGLRVSATSDQFHDTIAEDHVIGTTPEEGKTVDYGSGVTLQVSAGPMIKSGFVTYIAQKESGATLYVQRQGSDLVPLVINKEAAEVLDYTPHHGGLFAIWVKEDGNEYLYIVNKDGLLILGGIRFNWVSVTDGDWSMDGDYLVLEAKMSSDSDIAPFYVRLSHTGDYLSTFTVVSW